MIPVVIPAKPLARALGRLAAVADQATRRALQAAMLTDVIEAATAFSDDVVVVTGDPVVVEIARSAGARIVADADPPQGINHAVRVGIEAVDGPAVMVLMGDVPGVTADELRRVATAMADGEPGVALAVSADGTGTNALVLRPPRAIAPAFGSGSLTRHLASARSERIECALVNAPGLAIDIDTPEDLAAFAQRGSQSHTQELCVALGLVSRESVETAG